MRRHGISAEATTVVGDTSFDIEMGRRAGCHTIGVTWGNHSEQMLRQAGAEEIKR